MVARLVEDHENARALAAGLGGIRGLAVDAEAVQTNMVAFDVQEPGWDAAGLVGALAAVGLLSNAMGPRRIRLVTHKDVPAADVPEALDRIERVLRSGPGGGARAQVYG
jgi:threonine aldolase